MSCLIFHKWRPHYRALNQVKSVQITIPTLPGLFSGPPLMVPIPGAYFTIRRELVEHRCVRCGKRKAP